MSDHEVRNVFGGYDGGSENPCTGNDMSSCLSQMSCSAYVGGRLLQGRCEWHYFDLYPVKAICVIDSTY